LEQLRPAQPGAAVGPLRVRRGVEHLQRRARVARPW
jgi:hypothetical protein